jgi:hypothetical protein
VAGDEVFGSSIPLRLQESGLSKTPAPAITL